MKTDPKQQTKEELDVLYPIANKIAEREAKLYMDDFHLQIDKLSLVEQLLKIQNEKQLLLKEMDDFEAEESLNLDSKSDLYKLFASQIFLDCMKVKEKLNKDKK